MSIPSPEHSPDLPSRVYLGATGIVMCGDAAQLRDVAGCLWKLAGNPWGTAVPREAVGDRAEAHGQYDATRFYGSRSITLAGSCRAPDHATLHQAYWRLRRAIGVQRLAYRVTEPGFDATSTVRQSGELLWTENSHTHASFSAGLYAADPRLFSTDARTSGLVRLPFSSGGLAIPATVPWVIDTQFSGGRVALENPGTEAAGLRMRVDGPLTDAVLTLVPGDPAYAPQTQRLANPAGPLLRVGEWLDIDTELHQIRINGQSSRRSWTWGDWLTIPALAVGAAACQFGITGTGGTEVSGVTATWRTARI